MIRSFFTIIAICILIPALGFASETGQKAEYIISYSPGTLFHTLVRDRTKAVYERAGINAKFIELPHNRSLMSANEGSVDGDVGRVPAVEKKYPNLRRVNVKLMELNGAVYTTREDINAYHEDLLTTHRVGYVLGVQWTKKRMEGKPAVTVRDYDALFDMLLSNRLDLVLATEASADSVIEQLGDNAETIKKLRPFIFTAPIYHYVNEKNSAIIPQLEKALLELQQENYWSH